MRKIIIHKVRYFGSTYLCKAGDGPWLNGRVLGVGRTDKVVVTKQKSYP